MKYKSNKSVVYISPLRHNLKFRKTKNGGFVMRSYRNQDDIIVFLYDICINVYL